MPLNLNKEKQLRHPYNSDVGFDTVLMPSIVHKEICQGLNNSYTVSISLLTSFLDAIFNVKILVCC